MRDHKYTVVTCPHCHRSFVIVVRWIKTVRCRYCGHRIKVNLERRVLYRNREDAVEISSGKM